jgi:UDP-N-acetylglucosamine 2-epimerase (non-hydrolysing)
MHRVLVDRLSSIHYAPTEGARQNLLAENSHNADDVKVVGNTVVDALMSTVQTMPPDTDRDPSQRVVLVTAHRRENFNGGIASICEAIRRLCLERDNLQVRFVLHTNPAAFRPVRALLGSLPNVELLPPQPYRAFVRLLASADVVLTDSGGIQEEAPYLGKPVIVTREVTERPEASKAGTATIVGTNPTAIVEAVNALLDDALVNATMSRRIAPYGDGQASARIRRDLIKRFDQQDQLTVREQEAERRSERTSRKSGQLVLLGPTEMAS